MSKRSTTVTEMDITQVDEWDAQVEMTAKGFRMLLIKPGRRVTAYDIDGNASRKHSRGPRGTWVGRLLDSCAIRPIRGGVTLMYLAPPPEATMDQLDGQL